MREFANNFTEYLLNGLNKEDRVALNMPGLETALNVEKLGNGLVKYRKGDFIKEDEFPYPQIFDLSHGTYFLYYDRIEKYNPADGTVTVQFVSITPDNTWHTASVNGELGIATNGTTFVVLRNEGITAKDLNITTVAADQSRFYLGGFEDLVGTTLGSVLINFNESSDNFDKSTIMWTPIGNFSFIEDYLMSYVPPWSANNTRSDLMRMVRENDIGWTRLPGDNKVRVLKQFNQSITAYATQGIFSLVKNNQYVGVNLIFQKGIKSRLSVASNNNQHMFISDRDELCVYSSDGIQIIGYEKIFRDIVPVVFYDFFFNRFIIAHLNGSFIFHEGILTQISDRITAVSQNVKKGFIGLESNNKQIKIVTLPFDLAIRGLKTITSINAAVYSDTDHYHNVHYKYKDKNQWYENMKVVANDEGVTFIRTSGLVLKIELNTIDPEYFEVNSLEIKWQSDDKRYSRGTHLQPSVGEGQ